MLVRQASDRCAKILGRVLRGTVLVAARREALTQTLMHSDGRTAFAKQVVPAVLWAQEVAKPLIQCGMANAGLGKLRKIIVVGSVCHGWWRGSLRRGGFVLFGAKQSSGDECGR